MEQNPQGLLGRYHSKLAFVHRIADALVIMLVLRVSAASYGIVWGERYVIAGVLAILLFHLFGESLRLHRPWSDNPAGEFLQPIVFAWAPTALGLAVFAWSMKVTADYSRVAIGLWMDLHTARPDVVANGSSLDKMVVGSGKASVERPEFRWVNTMLGNIKSALRGTYHAIRPKYAQRYLSEFEYRFNRRFDLPDIIPGLAYVALRTPPMPQRLLKLNLA